MDIGLTFVVLIILVFIAGITSIMVSIFFEKDSPIIKHVKREQRKTPKVSFDLFDENDNDAGVIIIED